MSPSAGISSSMLPTGLVSIPGDQPSLRRSLGTGLLFLVVLEASLLGSGQMLHVAGVTVKMILFSLSILYVIVSLLCGEKVTTSSVLILSALFCCLAIATVQGIFRGATMDYIRQDISPQLYFLMLPFFEMTIRSVKVLTLTVRIIMFSAMVMTFVNVVMLVGLISGRISIADLYDFLLAVGAGDFMYDGLTYRIFYKGSIFIGIALLLFAFRKGKWAKLGVIISAIALLLTVSRGFLFGLFGVILLYVVIKPSRSHVKAAYLSAVVLGMGLAMAVVLGFAGDKAESDTIRIVTIDQVKERVNIETLFLGHGFGIGVPERPEHMEIAYLETFHKQGVLGLMWLGAIIALLIIRFWKALNSGHRTWAYPLFLSPIFILIESATNPFINNPIGLSAVLICLAGLRILAEPGTSADPSFQNKELAFG